MRRVSITQISTVECSPISLSAVIKFGSLTWTYEGCEGRILRGAVMTRNTPYVGGLVDKYVHCEGLCEKGYSLSEPVEDLSGPRQNPFASATGTSPW